MSIQLTACPIIRNKNGLQIYHHLLLNKRVRTRLNLTEYRNNNTVLLNIFARFKVHKLTSGLFKGTHFKNDLISRLNTVITIKATRGKN